MSKHTRPRTNNKLIAAGLIGVIALGVTFPYFYARTGPAIDPAKPYSGQAAVRGAYINSGSRDIGPDPAKYDQPKGPARHLTTTSGGMLLCRMKQANCQHTTSKHAAFAAFQPCFAHQKHPKKNAQKLPKPQHRLKRAERWNCQAEHGHDMGDQSNDSTAYQWWHQIDLLSRQAMAACIAAVHLSVLPLTAEMAYPPSAAARLNSPNAQIPRSVDAALRRSIPAFNKDLREVQGRLEDVAFKLRIPQRKPWQGMADNIAASQALVQQPDKMMFGVPKERQEEARQYISAIQAGLKKVQGAIDLKDSDRTSSRTADVLRNVAELELIEAPTLSFVPPKSYNNLPQLRGRGVVELTIEKPDGSDAYVVNEGGGPRPQAHLTLVLEGYSAPVTAGNFAVNVMNKQYLGKSLIVDYTGILVGKGEVSGQKIPLEILPLGDFEPIYGSPLNVQAGELPVLPMSIYGSVAMAHAPDADEGFAAADEFFIYKYDRAASGLAGLSFDEGTFGVFGYIAKGIELVPQLTSGDVIVAAELVSGQSKLTIPEKNR